MAKYLTYPFKTMRITQNYSGSTSHKPHSIGSPSDYPIDEGGKDSGRDTMYAPCDLIIKRIYGVGTGGTNTVWAESAEKVKTPAGVDYITLMITHPNDNDIKRLKVYQKIKKGDFLCYEGTDGASGNHIHLSVGFGKMKGNGWVQNSKGKWVLSTTGKTLKPEQAFYIDKTFTKVVSSNGITFKPVPFVTGDYIVRTAIYVREGAGKTCRAKSFKEFTVGAQSQIKKLNNGKAISKYIAGVSFTAAEVEYNEKDKFTWGRTPSGWVALDKCDKI